MPDPIDPSRLPRHIGIIMDGNGRWARQRGKKRSQGHREGLQAAKRVVKAASDLGIRYLSLYTFSTENWKRAEKEVSYLMFLIRTHLRREYDFYRENRIRVVHSGDLGRLPADVIREIDTVVRDTAAFSGLTVNLAINYGGRDEIVRAVNRLLAGRAAVPVGEGGPAEGGASSAAPVGEADIREWLDHPEIPDPDLIIRTGGECRISNFLLWEGAYAELDFSARYWPDWGEEDLMESLRRYQQRERRYGGVS
jgi:undecaprenyl diphosphate synthase